MKIIYKNVILECKFIESEYVLFADGHRFHQCLTLDDVNIVFDSNEDIFDYYLNWSDAPIQLKEKILKNEY